MYNSAGGYIARLLNIHGPALTLTTYTWPFLTALNQARLALVCRRIQRAVVVGVETYSALLEDAYRRLLNKDEVPWKPGSVAWVLDQGNQASKGGLLLGEIMIQEEVCEPDALLSRIGECWHGEGLVSSETNHPMAYAFALTDALSVAAQAKGNAIQYVIKSGFGKAQLEVASQI